jgi:hypothetical protein
MSKLFEEFKLASAAFTPRTSMGPKAFHATIDNAMQVTTISILLGRLLVFLMLIVGLTAIMYQRKHGIIEEPTFYALIAVLFVASFSFGPWIVFKLFSTVGLVKFKNK